MRPFEKVTMVCRFRERLGEGEICGSHIRLRGQVLEGLDERPFSSVDKSRQGSHSLINANVCEMFHGLLAESRGRSY